MGGNVCVAADKSAVQGDAKGGPVRKQKSGVIVADEAKKLVGAYGDDLQCGVFGEVLRRPHSEMGGQCVAEGLGQGIAVSRKELRQGLFGFCGGKDVHRLSCWGFCVFVVGAGCSIKRL